MRVKPVLLLRVIKILGQVSGIWPIFDSQVWIRIIKELVWFVSIVNITLIIIPTILRIHKDINEDQPLNALHSLSALPVYAETFVNLIMWKYNKSQIQGLLMEMFHYIKSVKGRDKNVLSKSINHHLPLYIFVVVFCTIACVSHLSVPVFTPQKLLPSIAHYPFSIEPYTTTYYLVYTQQAIANLQCGLHHTVAPIIIAMLLSYVTAKLRVLSLALKNVGDVDEFNNWIRQHRDCIRYFEQLDETVRVIIFKSFVIITLSVILGGIKIVHTSSIIETTKFLFIVIAGCLAVYVYIPPADDLYEFSEKVSWSLYESSWIDKPIVIRKSIIIMMCRSQKPLTISFRGIIPALNKNFYSTYLSVAMSYYMTLRVLFK